MYHESFSAHYLVSTPSEFDERSGETTSRLHSATIDNLIATKRINTNIKAFERIGNRDSVRLIVIIDGPEESSLSSHWL